MERRAIFPSLLLIVLACSLFPHGYAKTALQQHPSPYLRDHATDPVQWQVISVNLLKKASKHNRPILISSGYQSCYWCYRMKVDTFSDSALAQLVNDNFIPVLIDRELEPAIDQKLQTFMEAQRGFGGWPLTVILTPQGYPVAGFSYMRPKAMRHSLQQFLKHWQTDPAAIIKLAGEASEIREQKARQQNRPLENPDYRRLLEGFLQQISTTSDDKQGGFGDKEKFPNVPQLNALLDIYTLKPDKALKSFLELTLDNMQQGALRDQLAGGFFRYAGNRDWSAPHFEQMLYTQALLGKLYIRAGQTFKRPDYRDTGIQALQHMVQQFKGQHGLYDASLSAVSGKQDGQAGGYYYWSTRELKKLLGKEWPQQVKNLSDNKHMLLPRLTGKKQEAIRTLLLKHREQRPRSRDTKKLLPWHGLVLSALAYAAPHSRTLAGEANALAKKLLTQVEKEQLEILMVAPQDQAGEIALSNLVYVAGGLLDWWQISASEQALTVAEALLLRAYEQFYSDGYWQRPSPYGLFSTTRSKALTDTQLPSPSAIWLSLAWALSTLNPDSALYAKAEEVGRQLPLALQEDAFFHATLIAAIIARQIQVRNNRRDTPPVSSTSIPASREADQ